MQVLLPMTWSRGEREQGLKAMVVLEHKSSSLHCLSQPEAQPLQVRNRLIPFITVTFKYKPAGKESSSQSHPILSVLTNGIMLVRRAHHEVA